MTGGWLFGYVDALKLAGIQTVVVCVSAHEAPGWYTHRPTGARIRILRVTRSYSRLRPLMRDPYGWNFEQMFGRRPSRPRLLRLVRAVAPYLPTPPLALARTLRSAGCDAVLCQEYEYPRFDLCVLLGKLLGIPAFGIFQGGDYHLSRFERTVRPRTLGACAGVVVPTPTEEARVRERYGVPGDKVARIPNPVDHWLWQAEARDSARAALDLPADAGIVVWHGRVVMHGKGLDVLLDAWRGVRAAARGRDLRLLLVGSGVDAGLLRARLDGDGYESVQWIPEYVVDHAAMLRYLSAADVYAFPSRHEGLPVALIEAMACGLPVVAADVPGAADILAGGEAHGGILVPVGDAERLAAALERVLSDSGLAAQLGRRARQRVEESFSPDAVGRQLAGFLALAP